MPRCCRVLRATGGQLWLPFCFSSMLLLNFRSCMCFFAWILSRLASPLPDDTIMPRRYICTHHSSYRITPTHAQTTVPFRIPCMFRLRTRVPSSIHFSLHPHILGFSTTPAIIPITSTEHRTSSTDSHDPTCLEQLYSALMLYYLPHPLYHTHVPLPRARRSCCSDNPIIRLMCTASVRTTRSSVPI